MPLYRKKPVMIEAYLWDGGYESAMRIMEWSGQQVVMVDVGTGNETLSIKTLEGVMTGNKGDFIIRGTQGEYYPCKPVIFEDSYEELVEEEKPWWAEQNERLITDEEYETYKLNEKEEARPKLPSGVTGTIQTQEEYRVSEAARTGD